LTEKHSFFIPDADYLVDLEGLLTYLGEKVGKTCTTVLSTFLHHCLSLQVGQGYLCLWCNVKSKVFQSLPAVQKHMLDKGHCKLRYDGNAFLEYSRFYDYHASYPEGEEAAMEEDDEEEVEVDTIDDSGYELVLPSGARIGHRSLMKYYK
jgi:pre-60S factor REI1